MNLSMAARATEVMGPEVSPERTMSRKGLRRIKASMSSESNESVLAWSEMEWKV